MYTFDDWLNDRIDEKSEYPVNFSEDGEIIEYELQPTPIEKLFYMGKVDNLNFDKIRKAQEDTFNHALEMSLIGYESYIKEGLNKALKKMEFLKFALNKLKEERNNNLDAYGYSNTFKYLENIIGSDYIRIKEYWEQYKNKGQIVISWPSMSGRDLVNFRMHLIRGEMQIIKEERAKLKGKSIIEKKIKTVNPGLTLKDILIEGIEAEEVKKMFYSRRNHTKKRLAMYLRHLIDKGYYTREISWPETFIIAKNDFNITLSENRYKPPKINSREYMQPEWSYIPEASELLKSKAK